MAMVAIDGVRLETRVEIDASHTDRTSGSVPWIVLLHEGLGSTSLWRDFPALLSRQTGCPVLAWSRRGYGQSDPLPPVAATGPRRPVSFMHDEARDVLPKLLAAHGIGPCVLVGHSDGASIALVAAALQGGNTAEPASGRGLIRGAVLMAPHVFVEPISVTSIARMRASYLEPGSQLRARLARHHAHVDDAFLGWADTWLEPSFRAWSLTPEIARLAVPTLLIQGDADEYGTFAHVEAIAAGTAGPVTRLDLAGCGHAPHREREAEVVAAIRRFTDALAAGGRGR